MEINLHFQSLDELTEWTQWASQRGQYTEQRAGDLVHITDTRPITAEGALIPEQPPIGNAHVADGCEQFAQEAPNADAGEPPADAPAPEAATKRKRRAKAEIEADKQAADLAADVNAATRAELIVVDEAEVTTLVVDAHIIDPVIVALAGTLDGADKLAHMNEGREFISKHGFPEYNETFALVDVPANIAAHTPEQAALHRAAMQWLAQDGDK